MEKLKKITTTKKSLSTKSYQQYESLLGNLKSREDQLKSLVHDALAQETIYSTQAQYLIHRVRACIEFNSTTLPKAKSDMDEFGRMLLDLKSWIFSLKAMIKFHSEIKIQVTNIVKMAFALHKQFRIGRAFYDKKAQNGIERVSNKIPDLMLWLWLRLLVQKEYQTGYVPRALQLAAAAVSNKPPEEDPAIVMTGRLLHLKKV